MEPLKTARDLEATTSGLLVLFPVSRLRLRLLTPVLCLRLLKAHHLHSPRYPVVSPNGPPVIPYMGLPMLTIRKGSDRGH